MINFIIEKMYKNIKEIKPFPCRTTNGIYDEREDGFWIGGFYTGLNWLMYKETNDEIFKNTARKAYERLKYRLYNEQDTLDHDIGFLYSLSAVADYKITGNDEIKADILTAADELCKRYNEKGKYIRAWNVWDKNDPFISENDRRIILDCMYNLPILFFASEISGDKKYYNAAYNHANTCKKFMIRDDGSSYHTFVFNKDGTPKYGQTRQGYSDSSCWSRGHAWLIGGFCLAYKYTGNEEFLKASKSAADYFYENLESDFVPMWDFKLPTKENEQRDSSAAAIAASGMLEIGGEYEKKAEKIIKSLYENYSTKNDKSHQGLLLHACGNKPENIGTDTSLIFGDYYFCEAVFKLKNKNFSIF